MDWGTKDEQEKSNLRFKVAESREENDAGCERVFSINLVSKLASVSSRIFDRCKSTGGFLLNFSRLRNESHLLLRICADGRYHLSLSNDAKDMGIEVLSTRHYSPEVM